MKYVPFEDLMESGLWHYVSIWGDDEYSRIRFLDHVFLVNGNGYGWVETDGVTHLAGQYLPTDYYRQTRYEPDQKMRLKHMERKYTDQGEMEEARIEDALRFKETKAKWAKSDHPFFESSRTIVHIHSLSEEYNMLFTMPNNADRDVMGAALVLCDFIVDNYGDESKVIVSEKDMYRISAERTLIRNILGD